jgi:predicted RNA binding protein YcfA (HicA-like mRNA interferase family)
VSRVDKLLERLLSGRADSNLAFEDLLAVLTAQGFALRHGKGSHIVATKPGIVERITLQPDGRKAKAYQVRQVRNVLLKYAAPESDPNA